MRPILLPVVLAAVLAAAACSPTVRPSATAAPSPSPTGDPVRVGTTPDPESRLLAEVLAELLRAGDQPATVVEFADSAAARQAIELGAVDVRPAYTGEAWLEVLGRADPPADGRTSFARVRDHDERNGIVWMRPAFGADDRPARLDEPPANATFAFVVQGPPGRHADLTDMTGLARRLADEPQLQVCVDPDFADRPDGIVRVWDAYGVARARRPLGVAPADAVAAVARGVCVAGLTSATDGAAWLAGQRPLVDDLGVFPAFVVTAQVRQDAVDRAPQLLVALGPLPAELTTELLGRWNARVAAGERVEVVAEEAAHELLVRTGRALPAPPDETAPPG